jgi:hypothetical protein
VRRHGAVVATAPLAGEQGDLLDPSWHDPAAADAAFARLRAELGTNAIALSRRMSIAERAAWLTLVRTTGACKRKAQSAKEETGHRPQSTAPPSHASRVTVTICRITIHPFHHAPR